MGRGGREMGREVSFQSRGKVSGSFEREGRGNFILMEGGAFLIVAHLSFPPSLFLPYFPLALPFHRPIPPRPYVVIEMGKLGKAFPLMEGGGFPTLRRGCFTP